MPTIILSPGDTLKIEISEGDGGFEIKFTETELTVTSEFAGSHVGIAGVIHREVFAGCTCPLDFSPEAGVFRIGTDPKCPEHNEEYATVVAEYPPDPVRLGEA